MRIRLFSVAGASFSLHRDTGTATASAPPGCTQGYTGRVYIGVCIQGVYREGDKRSILAV